MAQSLAKMIVHVVYSTKKREPVLSKKIHENLYAYTVGRLNLTNNIYGRNLHCPFRAIVFIFFVTQRGGCASALGCDALPLAGRCFNFLLPNAAFGERRLPEKFVNHFPTNQKRLRQHNHNHK
jgi:hypothetical protein